MSIGCLKHSLNYACLESATYLNKDDIQAQGPGYCPSATLTPRTTGGLPSTSGSRSALPSPPSTGTPTTYYWVRPGISESVHNCSLKSQITMTMPLFSAVRSGSEHFEKCESGSINLKYGSESKGKKNPSRSASLS